MTLRFVSTSILESSDGIDFSKETAIDSEEARAVKREAEKAEAKPLYLQLAEIQARKQEEYDMNTKLMHAPPKALDEDDIAYYEGLEFTKKAALEARHDRDEAALQAFRSARHAVDHGLRDRVAHEKQQQSQKTASTSASSAITNTKKNIEASLQPTLIKPIIKAKRKLPLEGATTATTASDSSRGSTLTTAIGDVLDASDHKKLKKNEVGESMEGKAGGNSTTTMTGANNTNRDSLSLLAGYSSDED